MIKYISIFLLILLCSAKEIKESGYYNKNRTLIADTTLSLSKAQLKKWMMIEDSLTKFMTKEVKYPAMAHDAMIQVKIIVSFAVNDSGKFSGYELVKDSLAPRNPNDPMFLRTIVYSLEKLSGKFFIQGFKASKGKSETYYLPVGFTITGAEKFPVGKGWIKIIGSELPPSPKAHFDVMQD